MDSEKERFLDSLILKHEKKILIVLICLALIYILFLAKPSRTQWAQDSHWHMALADNVLKGKGYSTDGKYPIF